MYKLVISDDEGKTTVVPLVRNEITIGRKEGNTIRLTERNVSRKHARLARSNGHFVIHDLESYNGVRINGRRIDQDTQLEAGDKVVIGDYVLALQNEEPAAVGQSGEPGYREAAAAAIPPARLVMLTPPAPGAEFALPEGAIKIGRAEDLDVWVNHRSISREHAEIRREGSQFQVVDLESANGVRLNNDEVTTATLSPGDELELGQVRFRFVGEGERYSFEADRTVQMDALVMPSPADPRKRNTLIGVGIVVMAIVVAGLLAITDSGRPTPEPVVTPIQETPPPENALEDSAQRFLAATEACVEALRNEDFVAANAAAERALAINADSAMAADCQRRAQGRVGAQQQFEEGVEHLSNGRVEDAWMAFDSLPTDSAFRERPEVEQARTAFVEHYFQAAQTDAENGDRGSALRQLDQVFNHSEEDSEIYTAAEELRRELEAQARNERGPRNMRRGPRNTMTIIQDTTPMMTTSVMMTTEMQSTRLSGREVMRECNFNNRCVIQRLNGSPTTRESLPFLIEAYKAVGNAAAAQRLIQDYLRRYPSGAAAAGYRRQVSAQN